MGVVGHISPKNMTDRPILEHRMGLDQSSNTRRRMDPLSDLFGSMSIQEAVYKRLEATAPWGVCYSGDTGPRIRFMLVVRGSALLKFKNPRRTFSLSGGDLFISILSYEPFILVDHPRSAVVDSSEVLKLEVDGVIHYGGGGPLTTLVSGEFGMSTFGAPLISTILPRFLHLRLEQNRSHDFQSVLDQGVVPVLLPISMPVIVCWFWSSFCMCSAESEPMSIPAIL